MKKTTPQPKFPETLKIKQKSYGLIEFDNTEQDHIRIAMTEDGESDSVLIERANIDKVIKLLQSAKKGVDPRVEVWRKALLKRHDAKQAEEKALNERVDNLNRQVEAATEMLASIVKRLNK